MLTNEPVLFRFIIICFHSARNFLYYGIETLLLINSLNFTHFFLIARSSIKRLCHVTVQGVNFISVVAARPRKLVKSAIRQSCPFLDAADLFASNFFLKLQK